MSFSDVFKAWMSDPDNKIKFYMWIQGAAFGIFITALFRADTPLSTIFYGLGTAYFLFEGVRTLKRPRKELHELFGSV